ncbi:rna-directed dna polymerase from mobile element jockey-like [Willisornis vidua]|uniref:Rna-directed dna polymerase from mobile element jockey-like n=1 Tax=Willisornis vidua TaxID=1566151 RepID=A0ABQ9D6R4_9PASS|nr:rna-directed dna polymerase from mobile element jockey-like [Willisornis vidua]
MTKLRGAVDSLECREALQRDLDKLQDWGITNHRKFNKGKCRILHFKWSNPRCVDRLGNECWKMDLGVLANGKLNLSQQCPVRRTNRVLGDIRHSTTSQLREGIVLLCSVLVRPHLQYWRSFGDCNIRKILSH